MSPSAGALVVVATIVAVGDAPVALLRALDSTRWPRRRRSDESDHVALAELFALAVNAGLSAAAALSRIASSVPQSVRTEIESVLARARVSGLEAALLASNGPSQQLFHLIARAVGTGASLGEMLDRYVDALLDEQHTREMSVLRRLPVKLLFPLALLILPGFVLLVLGPALIESFGRLSSSLPSVPGRSP